MPRTKFRPVHRPSRQSEPSGASAAYWLFGLHPARAAIANPNRKIRRAVITEKAQIELGSALAARRLENVTVASPDAVARLVVPGAVHQGIALLCEPLPALDIDDALAGAPAPRLVAVLDQVTDPHNEGAILRSAAAFGLAAVIVQDRHASPESGVLAKSASGALDLIPRVSVVNIARALEELGRLGFWRIALVAEGESPFREAVTQGDMALVLGAEGAGLRRLVRERCDTAASIPMSGAMESLNVSNAAAIAFYELRRK